jgi:hypothetical protein
MEAATTSRPATPIPTPLQPVTEDPPVLTLPSPRNPLDTDDDLELYFDSVVNGDIYDKKNKELVCTSGRQHIVVRGIGNIHEQVVETYPCFDGTLIRAFYYKESWHLATRKKINAFESRWNQSQSFGELFEEISKTKVEYLSYSLNPNFAYSFLLLTPVVTNVLYNQISELIFVSAYDRKKQIWEQVQGETFKTLVIERPPFANRIIKSDTLPRFDPENEPPKTLEERVKKENDMLEKTVTNPQRNQRGLLFTGKSGRLYRQDFQVYRNWQRIISERPLFVVFFEQLKKAVKKDPSCVLTEFYKNYQNFAGKGLLFEMTVRVIRYQFQSNLALPKPLPHVFQQLFEAVRERNKLPIPSFEFIRRTIAFQKYSLLSELFFNESGKDTRNFVHQHRNMYTKIEHYTPPPATQFYDEESRTHIGNGTLAAGTENESADDDGVIVVGIDDVREGSDIGGGPDVKTGRGWYPSGDDCCEDCDCDC